MAGEQQDRPGALPPQRGRETVEARLAARRQGRAGPILLGCLIGGALTLLLVALVGRGLLAGPAIPTPTHAPLISFPPTPTPTIITSAAVVRQIQQLSRLETTSYSVQTVVTVERPGNLIGIGRQRVLVIVHGRVVAGIDLSKLRAQDVTISPDGREVTVQLPPAEILSHHLDESRTQLYDHQTGLFTRPDPNLVIEAQKAGADQILRSACEDGIMQRATEDGQHAIQQLLLLLDFERVNVEAARAPPCPAAPAPPQPTPKP